MVQQATTEERCYLRCFLKINDCPNMRRVKHAKGRGTSIAAIVESLSRNKLIARKTCIPSDIGRYT